MSDDTDIGGGRRAFPETRLSLLAGIASDDDLQRRRAWDLLVESYWRPVYRHLRLRWSRSNEDAKDLTQAFFAAAMEKDFFAGYDPARSRFRSFLRLVLDGFVLNADKAARAWKRGGGARLAQLDFEDAEGEVSARPMPADQADADRQFTAEWRRGIFQGALTRLADECRAAGREDWHRLFVAYDLAPDAATGRPGYEQLAKDHAIPVTTVTNRLATIRRELRRIILERLRAESANEEEFQEDLRALLGEDGS